MAMISELLEQLLLHKGLTVVSGLLLTLVYHLYIKPNYVSGLANLPGPPSSSLLSGNLTQVLDAELHETHLQWAEQYGKIFKYRATMGSNRLYVTDPKALQHILLNRSYDYPKPFLVRQMMNEIVGKGILFAEGDEHKRQKRVLNQAFTRNQVNSYLPIFQEQADKLRSRLMVLVESSSSNVSGEKGVVLNVCSWLSRCTLEVIGKAGFNYDFNQMDGTGDDNALANVFRDITKPRKVTTGLLLFRFLIPYFPFLTKLPTKGGKAIRRSMAVMQGEGRKMLETRLKQAEAGELDDKTDLLSLVVKANIAAAGTKDAINEEEIMGQVATFTLAGHETSSVSLSWILYYMALHPDMQNKLRKEVRGALAQAKREDRPSLSAEQLTNLPYLDAVIRETMRYIAPVQSTVRESAHDDIIPLSEPVIGVNGKLIEAIPVKKGQVVTIAIATMNHSKLLFGDDASEYRPERWLEQDLEGKARFTTWAPLLTFLGGPRGCIGYKFAISEISVILATLIDAFEFSEREVGDLKRITRKANLVVRPVIVGEEEKGAQLPLRIRKAL